MPAKLPQVKARDLVKVAKKLGLTFRSQSGSQAVFVHADGSKTTIPVHPAETIGIGLLTNGIGLLTKIIRKDLKITKEEFTRLLKS